jgi:hypothetical protein
MLSSDKARPNWLAGDLDQIVLTPLALQIGHDLGLRRLAHVNDGLALQDGGGDQVSARHRQAPRR